MTTTFLQTIETDFQTAENWVVNFFATLKTDVAVAEGDIIQVFQFLQPYAQGLATGLTGLIGIAAALNVGLPAPVFLAASAVNAAAQAVNAAIAAQQQAQAAGQSNLQQVAQLGLTAYQQLKTAQQHLAAGQAAVASPASTP